MSYASEYGEDRWIAENIALPENGFYVDAGCYLPEHFSNTHFLRARGWSGLVIDMCDYSEQWRNVHGAQFIQAALCEGVRKAAIGGSGPCAYLGNGDALDTVPLSGFVNGRQVDFLSVDLEGNEFNALRSFPFDSNRPRVIVAEYATSKEGKIERDWRAADFLADQGYLIAHQTIANLIYVPR